MNSISPECQELKVQYDACFNRWFKEKFLKGLTDDTLCADLFASYQSCVKVTHVLCKNRRSQPVVRGPQGSAAGSQRVCEEAEKNYSTNQSRDGTDATAQVSGVLSFPALTSASLYFRRCKTCRI